MKYFISILLILFTSGIFNSIKSQEEIRDLINMTLEELMQIDVTTAGKKSEKISDIPASVKIITRNEIEINGYQNLEEVLENVIGLYIIDNKTFHYITIGVRGYWTQLSRNVVVLINGINQLEEFHADYPNTWGIPVEAIDRIEIIRGPMSVIYGTGAFFGAINIITNEVSEGQKNSSISGTYGSNETFKIHGRAAGRSEDITYSFNGSYYQTDGLDVDYSDITTMNNKLKEWGITNSNTESKYKREQKYFDLSVDYKNFHFEVNNKNIRRGFNYTQPHPGDEPNVRQSMTNSFAGYKKVFSKNYTLDFRLTYSYATSRYHLVWDDDKSPYPYSESISEFYEFELINFFQPFPKLNITIGLNHHNTLRKEQSGDFVSLNNYLLKYDENKSNTSAIYSQIDYDFSNKLKMVLGLRLERMSPFDIYYYGNQNLTDSLGHSLGYLWKDNIDRSDISFIPQASLIYKLNKNNIIKFLYGQAIMHPDILSDFDVMRQRFEFMDYRLTTDWLESEKITTYELNYQSIFTLRNNIRLGLNISLFDNILENLFSRKEQVINNNFITQSVNEGKLNALGLELSTTLEKDNVGQINFGMSYQDIEDEKNDREVGYSPELLGYLNAHYLINKSISVAITGLYAGEMLARWNNNPAENSPTNNPSDPTYLPIGRIGSKTDAYFKLGLNFRYKNFLYEGIYLNLHITNLMDTEIRTPVDDSNIWADKGMPSYGRRFYFNIGYKF